MKKTRKSQIEIFMISPSFCLFWDFSVRHYIDQAVIDKKMESIREAIIKLVSDAKFIHAITYSTNSLKQVATRFEMMEKIIEEVI